MLHLPIHPIFHISKYLFYPVDGIIHLFSCICNLALGTALCVTIIGIPFGLQQFKLAKLALMPFGAEVY